jgi:hypothetical protein
MIKARIDGPDRTAFDRTPFGILDATTRDSRRRIVELSEERSLTGDAEACSRARADLTNPRNRLGAEVAWLPGLSPARAKSYCDLLKHDLEALLAAAMGESPLVKANMIAAAMERFDPATDTKSWVTWIGRLAEATGCIDLEVVLRLLNEERAVAGFAEITAREFLDSELTGRRRVYRETIKDALDRLPSGTMVEVLSSVVESGTDTGARPGPILIDEVVDVFEIEARVFLDHEAENIRHLIGAVKDLSTKNDKVVGRLVDGLERVLRNWDRVTQPMQISMRGRGLEHSASRNLAYEIRQLAIELANTHGLFEMAQRITRLLSEVFGELYAVAEQLERDSSTLDSLVEEQRKTQERKEQWAREIAYDAELGLVFKDTLRLSTAGIEWKGARYPLEAVTRVGWGATKHSVNGIPTGTTYKILFGDDQTLSEVELSHEPIFSGFVDRLWRAVGVRLVTQLLQGLRGGGRYRVGQALVDDRGVEVPKRRLFKADERVHATWDGIHVWTADGSFCIGLKDDKKAYAAIPYQEANNVHVLEPAIRAAFKKGADRLSDILE